MKSSTESMPHDFKWLSQSVTAAAIFIGISFVPTMPVKVERLAQNANISRPTRDFTRTLQNQKSSSAITDRANEFITALRQLVAQHKLKWHAPTISQEEADGSIEISWWKSNRALIVTVEQNSPITFLKVWGPNIHSEMDGSNSPSEDQLIDLWQWLYA